MYQYPDFVGYKQGCLMRESGSGIKLQTATHQHSLKLNIECLTTWTSENTISYYEIVNTRQALILP